MFCLKIIFALIVIERLSLTGIVDCKIKNCLGTLQNFCINQLKIIFNSLLTFKEPMMLNSIFELPVDTFYVENAPHLNLPDFALNEKRRQNIKELEIDWSETKKLRNQSFNAYAISSPFTKSFESFIVVCLMPVDDMTKIRNFEPLVMGNFLLSAPWHL